MLKHNSKKNKKGVTMYNEEYCPPKSKTVERMDKETPQKRLTQLLMFKQIKKITKKGEPEGDWYHTAGPGKVKINYALYSNIVNPNNTYNIVEYFDDNYLLMLREFNSLNRFLKQEEGMNVKLNRGEFFSFVKNEIEDEKHVFVIDADFCASAKSIIGDERFIESFEKIARLQKTNKREWFFALTFSLRDPINNTFKYIDFFDHVCRFNYGKLIWEKGYRDGAPMKTMLWHFQY